MRIAAGVRRVFDKYKEFILYALFGLGATLINIAAFYLFCHVLNIGLIPANMAAWTLAFLFAFVTNKIWVFESRGWGGRKALKEFISFLLARLLTLALDTFLMWLLVNVSGMAGLSAKIIVNVVVIIINYAAGKLWVFRQ